MIKKQAVRMHSLTELTVVQLSVVFSVAIFFDESTGTCPWRHQMADFISIQASVREIDEAIIFSQGRVISINNLRPGT